MQTTVKGVGLTRMVGIKLVDLDSRQPIPTATLSVSATKRSGMRIRPRGSRVSPIFYRFRLVFPTPGLWSVHVRVGGSDVVPTAFTLNITVTRASV
jgi:hypothetical protein